MSTLGKIADGYRRGHEAGKRWTPLITAVVMVLILAFGAWAAHWLVSAASDPSAAPAVQPVS